VRSPLSQNEQPRRTERHGNERDCPKEDGDRDYFRLVAREIREEQEQGADDAASD
jgi:hypothetical protein